MDTPDKSRIEMEFPSWRDLESLLVHENDPAWIHRGLPSYSFSPTSRLERALLDSNIPHEHWPQKERDSIAFFKSRSIEYFDSASPKDDDLLGWLALMQHYGAPTRLTDWSTSPLIACYFAYQKVIPGEPAAALWAINAGLIRTQFGSLFPFGEGANLEAVSADENHLLRSAIAKNIEFPLPLPILRPDKRMAAQKACFVAVGGLGSKKTSIEKLMFEISLDEVSERTTGLLEPGRWIPTGNIKFYPKKDYKPPPTPDLNPLAGYEPKHDLQLPENLVRKVRLPYEWRDDALRSLARMGITSDNLIPTLDGVGLATDIYLQTNK